MSMHYLCVWKIDVEADTPEEAVKEAASIADNTGAEFGCWQVYPADQTEPGYDFDLDGVGYIFEDGDAPSPSIVTNIYREL